ncbi:MAG: hypothetical protein NTY37_05165 [Methanothrix sp.]|nr:hypothetical protein [Methanothrix sp.]
MRRTRIFLIIIPVLVVLCFGLIDSLADDQSGSTSVKKSPSELTGADRDLYQQFVSTIDKDPDYDHLGYTDEQFRYLTMQSDCFVLALNIKHPDISRSGELEMIGRPQIEMVTQIYDLEGYRGSLMEELKANRQLKDDVATLSGYISSFHQAVSTPGILGAVGLLAAFAQIGVEQMVWKPISKELTNYAFNHLYASYKDQRENGMDHAGAMDSVWTEKGPYWADWKNVLVYYDELNTKAKLGWEPNVYNDLVGKYLESRYKTDKDEALDPWEVPVTKPEHAMENLFRDALHTIKLQNIKDLSTLTDSCVHEMPVQEGPNCGPIDDKKLDKIESYNAVYYVDSNGLLQGPYKEYYDTEKTEIKTEGCYLNGKKSGHWIGISIYKYEGDYKDDMKEGHWVEYYSDGNTLFREGDYKDDKREGHWIFYDDNGKKASEGDYKNDMMEGHWIDNIQGHVSEGDYKDDMREGHWVNYCFDGKTVESEGDYKDGQLEGRWITYSCYSGKEESEEEYKNGENI